jgi:UTP:GlnB (protein PII) uridylyltransferase
MPWRADFDWTFTEGDANLPDAFVEEFSASMPARYRVLFDPGTIRRHAAVSHRRETRPAYAEVWRTLPDGSAAMCIVGEDRPGLLSTIAAALVLHKLDVLTALVFSRPLNESLREAVDLVWVRRANATDKEPIRPEEAVSIGEVLSAILAGKISVEQIASRTASPPAPDARIVVRFDQAEDEGLAALFVDAPDRPGILLTIAHALFQQGAQIVRSLVRTSEGRAFNRFELAEFNGGRLSPQRCEQIREAVHAALTCETLLK